MIDPQIKIHPNQQAPGNQLLTKIKELEALAHKTATQHRYTNLYIAPLVECIAATDDFLNIKTK